MIRVDFVPPTSGDWTSWVAECERATEKVVEAVQAGADPKLTGLYKDERLKRVYICDESPFFGKCAYCESDVLTNQPGDIEHYRPVAAVTEVDNTSVKVAGPDGTLRDHCGYYWCAYDWRNLLLSCADCNRPHSFKTGRQVGKWCKFPISGVRAVAPGEEDKEEPLLLNPMWNEPEEHLEVTNDGQLRHKTESGRVTILVLGLNAREALVRGRLEALELVADRVNLLAVACSQGAQDAIAKQTAYLERVKLGATRFAAAGRKTLGAARPRFEPLLETLG